MSLFVVSVATKPVMSDLMELEEVSIRVSYEVWCGSLLEFRQRVCAG